MWGRLAWLGRLFRTSEWYDTKLPLLLLVAYQSLLAGHSGAVGAGMLARAALYGAALLAFGYLINDLADTAVDRMAGKRRAMDGIARWLAWLICGIVAAVAALALRPSWGRPLVLILLALSLGLAAAYSLPPLRLKERGWLGLLTAAAAQRTVPGLTVAAFLGHLDWGIAWMGAIFLLMGLRYILLHQIMDAEHDRCARVRTYALAVGSVARLAATLNRIYLLELAALAALPFILGPACWWLGLVIWPYALYGLLRGRQEARRSGLWHPVSYEGMPLQTLYCIAWPLGLVAAIIVAQPACWPLLAVEGLWKYRLWQPIIVTRLQPIWGRYRRG